MRREANGFGGSVLASEAAGGRDRPIAFISSFYCEREGYANYCESPLWRLRQDLAALNGDDAFRRSLPLKAPRTMTWVAEKSGEPLDGPDKLAVVDRLVEVLRESELYVCILGDRRRGDSDHGSAVEVQGEATAVSYFEIELYAAAMYGKKVVLYVLEDFDPGPRLRKLLEILEWAIPDWQPGTRWTHKEILSDVKELIRRQCSAPREPEPPLRRRLVEALYRRRAGASVLAGPGAGLLFLGGATEARPLPDLDRVKELIGEYRKAGNFQKKLNRLWFAVRELMPASYRPEDVGETSALREFLPYWDCVLSDWVGAASWQGWHGHLYAGTVAPLNSQWVIRAQGFQRIPELQPEVILPPDDGLASAYYSIAGLLRAGVNHWKCLCRAGRHVKRAIDARGGPTENLLAIRGSIRLRVGLWPGAILDFTRMLRLREAANAPPEAIADALMHLGFAYSVFPVMSRGRDLLRKSVDILKGYPNNPNLARARRKLAFAYKIAGQRRRAGDVLAEAEADALRLGAYDQIGR